MSTAAAIPAAKAIKLFFRKPVSLFPGERSERMTSLGIFMAADAS